MRVLSIDGGGIRGIIPALVLGEIERRARRPVAELFDLVAGTSTGGLIGCAVAQGRPAGELHRVYDDQGPRIFDRSLLRRVRSVDGLLDERYDDTVLNAVLREELGDVTLGEARVPLLLTAYDLHERRPRFFKSWRDRDRDVPMVVAARATSAAPTYFEPILHEGASLVDGGVFATNPAMSAYAEAVRLAPGEDVRVVSLGTGELTRRIEHSDAKDWGQLEWVRPIIDVVFDGVADAVDYQLDQLLGDRHHRFQVELTRASDDLDDASPHNRARLRAHAVELLQASSAEMDAVVAALTAE